MAQSKKKELIVQTYELLKVHAPGELTIRMIAESAGCTSGAIYRHFDNLEDLILLASVRFLESYVIEVGGLLVHENDPLKQHIEMWRAFGNQAFKNVEVFEMLFWSKYESRLMDAMYSYYEEFPDNYRDLSGYLVMLFFSSNLRQRNEISINRAVAKGALPRTDPQLLSDLECCAFHGMLMEYRDTYRQEGVAEQAQARFMEMLDMIISCYLGTSSSGK